MVNNAKKDYTAAELAMFMPGVMTRKFVADLPEGTAFTISEIDPFHVKEFGGKEEGKCTALYFEETSKHLTLSGSRQKELDALFGGEGLLGKRISVKNDPVTGFVSITAPE